MQTCPLICPIPPMLKDNIDCLPFYTTFTDSAMPEVTRSAQSKTSWLHFVVSFSTDQDEIWYGVEAVQVNHLDYTFEWIWSNKRKNFNAGMYLNVDALIWFKLGLMLDPVQPYILILVKRTLILIQDHRCERKRKFMSQFIGKVFNRFEWNLGYCWNLLV